MQWLSSGVVRDIWNAEEQPFFIQQVWEGHLLHCCFALVQRQPVLLQYLAATD